MPSAALQKSACAFVSSSFGFGPVSKAATIAAEIKNRHPQIATHFFGSGIARRFAEQSKAFDAVIEAEVDDSNNLENLLPTLQTYEKVFSVLNLPLLPLWRRGRRNGYGKLFFVDSLAWMWTEPPAGVENAETYFVQDYLVPSARVETWSEKCGCRIICVPPIGMPPPPTTILPKGSERTRRNRLLVNFSGCFNQFTDPRVYEQYAMTLLPLIAEEATGKFDEVEVCVNQQLADELKRSFQYSFLKIGQLPHQEFLRKLIDSRFLLTAPGITTTLEAIATATPFGFLLPQNDSQAMMSELYRRQLNESLTLAFSRFDEKLAFPVSLEGFESLGKPVELAIERMCLILEIHQKKIRRFIAEMLNKVSTEAVETLKRNIPEIWDETGQSIIVKKVFGSH